MVGKCCNCGRDTIKLNNLCSVCLKIREPAQAAQMSKDRRRHHSAQLAYDGGWDDVVKAYEEDR